MITMEQLQKDASRRNDFILGFSIIPEYNRELDERLLTEAREELECGWAEGPF